MKKHLCLFLFAIVASIETMFASVIIDGIAYNLNETNLSAEVTKGSYADNPVIPSQVNYDDKTYSVTSIGANAFSGCAYLTSVTIPNSVTRIGESAFQGCHSLTSVTIPNSVTGIGERAFFLCDSMTSVTIGSSVQWIGDEAFCLCESLTSVTIPNSVMGIGEGAFDQCDGLTSVTIGNNVTDIGNYAFQSCSSLTSVEIPNSVGRIGHNAFAGCSGLTSVTIGNSVEYIGNKAFSNCSGLTSVTIPNSVTVIDQYAFRWCEGLTSVTIGNSVTSIGTDAFIGCSDLTSVTINSNAIVSKNYNISSTNIRHIFGGQVTSYIIGDSVTSIGRNAFAHCSNLTSVTISNSVTSIESTAFDWCESLESVTIGNSVMSVGNWAFRYCTSLTKVNISDLHAWYNISFGNEYSNPLYYAKHLYLNNVEVTDLIIPDDITSIRNYAFIGCSLRSITCEAIIPPDLGSSAFLGVDKSIPLYVPAQSISAYKTAEQWKGFRLILPIGFTGFTIDFVNWDGTELLTLTNVEAGTIPVYTGRTPTRPADSQYTYTFSDWSPSIVAATADTTYTATFTATPISQQTESAITVRLDPQSCSNWSVVRLWAWTSNGNLFSAWPGIVISQDDNGWYSYTFAENIDNVNIIWTDGTNQTIDITDIYVSTCYALNSTSGKNITVRVVECPETSETYTISFLNYDGTELQVLTEVEEGEMPVYTGETPTRPADSQYTYTFSGWTPEITEATEDATYTATFSNTLNIYTISANAINGEVEGTGEYAYGTEVELTAIPDNGYGFAQWSDGVIDNPRTIIVTGDAEYTALFVQGQGVEDVYVSEHVKKLIIDDKMYILRDGKTYTATGVKVE